MTAIQSSYSVAMSSFQARKAGYTISPSQSHRASKIIAAIDKSDSLRFEVPPEVRQKLNQIMRVDNNYFKAYGVKIEKFISVWESYCGIR